MTMQDNGKPFNPLKYDKVKTFSELAEGGMGISIVKQLADNVSYASQNGDNIFTMHFKLD